MKHLQEIICGAAGAVGGAIAAAFGGWSNDLTVLVAFMVIDYITGVLAACLCRSGKTEGTLLLVLVAHGLDVAMGVNYVRTAAVIAFIVNEALSILENAGLLGIPLPEVFKKALEVLKGKGEQDERH